MITTTNGGSVPRIALRSVEYSHRRLIEYSGLNSRVLDDLFEIIWHENLSLDNSAIRINVILPVEIRNECKKIDERRRKPNQKQSDIEATISKWANDNNVHPSHAVFIGPSAVLFFDDKEKAAMAHLFISDNILEFKQARYHSL
jgi:hypothetical protein